jgi:hypothetical protein
MISLQMLSDRMFTIFPADLADIRRFKMPLSGQRNLREIITNHLFYIR